MPRQARIIAPGQPHHIIQRGNRRMPVFFKPNDYQFYKDLLAEWCGKNGVEIWSYCLMPNHVHLIAVPPADNGTSLSAALSETHKRYTKTINKREDWTGHLWQGRYSSYVMDESYALCAARYIELNPVRAGLVARPEDYPWSSAAAYVKKSYDPVLKDKNPLQDLVSNWSDFLKMAETEQVFQQLEQRAA